MAAAAAGVGRLVLYDISSPLQPSSYAPNPSKSRLALSFKALPFTTAWVDIPDIPAVRQGLACPAVRTLDDGSDYWTLPLLRHERAGGGGGPPVVVGDSFDIAAYLQDTFPASGGDLFPPGSTRTGLDYESPAAGLPFLVPLSGVRAGGRHADYAAFNWHVDATFTAHVQLVGEHLPFNPASAAAVRALFAKRAHVASWDELRLTGAARQERLAAFEASLGLLAHAFQARAGGPYLEGAVASYADLVVGGWLAMMAACLPAPEWAAMRAWHGGVFGALHDALRASCWVCT